MTTFIRVQVKESSLGSLWRFFVMESNCQNYRSGFYAIILEILLYIKSKANLFLSSSYVLQLTSNDSNIRERWDKHYLPIQSNTFSWQVPTNIICKSSNVERIDNITIKTVMYSRKYFPANKKGIGETTKLIPLSNLARNMKIWIHPERRSFVSTGGVSLLCERECFRVLFTAFVTQGNVLLIQMICFDWGSIITGIVVGRCRCAVLRRFDILISVPLQLSHLHNTTGPKT